MCHMWIEFREIELAGDQEDHRSDRADPAIAARLALGGLKQSIEGFQEAVGLAGLCPGDDAVANLRGSEPKNLRGRNDVASTS